MFTSFTDSIAAAEEDTDDVVEHDDDDVLRGICNIKTRQWR